MIYRINEIFSSLQGEGLWKGVPANFIRMAGCNCNCPRCDTNFNEPVFKMSISEIMENLEEGYKRVVITGGEPLLQDLTPLLHVLSNEGYSIHLETNGTILPPNLFDWIAVSPKVIFGEQFKEGVFSVADEVKFPITQISDLKKAEEFRKEASSFKPSLVWYLHPWWNGEEAPEENTSFITQCISHAKEQGWRLDHQLHKIWKVR